MTECGFVLLTGGCVRAVDSLLDSQPPGFVELAEPGYNPLPWPSLGSMRFDERLMRRSLPFSSLKYFRINMTGILCPVFVPARYLHLTTSYFRFQNTALFKFQFQKHGKLFSANVILLHFWGSWANWSAAGMGARFVDARL